MTTAALAIGAVSAVLALTESPALSTAVPPGRPERAAIAVRDNVTPFQKWGTREFTLPYLERYYDRAWYFTQSRSEDCRSEFSSALTEALQRYPAVDLFLLAHSNHYLRWVADLPPEKRARLRLVYNTGCFDLSQGRDWIGLGAKAYVGHVGESASPVFYVYFLRRWTRGTSLQEAVGESNRRMAGAFGRASALSFGNLDAERLGRESEAHIDGNGSIRIGN
jgi:hypothetical protein